MVGSVSISGSFLFLIRKHKVVLIAVEVHRSCRLKFFVAKNHPKSSSLSNCSLNDSRLLNDVQHTLLKSRSTQRVHVHCACAYALPGPDACLKYISRMLFLKCKVQYTKKTNLNWVAGEFVHW